jgi:electron transport complex protein RnfE
VFGSWYNPALIFILPPGAFIVIGYIVGAIKMNDARKAAKLRVKGGQA